MYCIIVFSFLPPWFCSQQQRSVAICAADCVPYLWWLYHNFSLNCCHLWSISPALHFVSICIIPLCFFYLFFDLPAQIKLNNSYTFFIFNSGTSFKTRCSWDQKVFRRNAHSIPDNMFNEFKNTRASVKAGGLLLISISVFLNNIFADTCLFSDSRRCKYPACD